MLRSPRSASARTRALAVTAAVGMMAGTLATTTPAAMAAPPTTTEKSAVDVSELEDGRYVVVMKDRPVVAYKGGVRGLAATAPAAGEKVDADSAAANAYRKYLKGKQDAALRAAGIRSTIYRYSTAVSGFAADLSAEQAADLAKNPTVLSVNEDELRQLDTSESPDFLGLTGRDGVWAELGGPQPRGRRGAGSGVVVGIIDSGITPENPSFANNGMPRPIRWDGACETGEEFDRTDCNNKLIGARYFLDGFGEDNLAAHEFVSPRDADGHGTHTAGTAAGNFGVQATIEGRNFGSISGMAPAAHLAAYKVCWDRDGGGGGCFSSDSAAAIDQAVADGVDVLNFSISGTSFNYLDPVELAFMFAADAGVFVAASSGNSGPTASTTNHPSPWLTTVAASTHAIYEKTLVTGDGQRFIGASITEPLPQQTEMVLSEDIPAAGASAEEAGLCFPGSLDPAGANGKLVVCDRGVSPRVEKSQVVADAGGVGMVLLNVVEGSLDNDLHVIPTIHLPHTDRDDVREYVRNADDPTGAILDTNEGSTTEVPEVAGFSSRGPSLGADGDILKPDISAPGVGVLAAYSPVSAGRNFDFLSGTSMSSPHIAGLAALVIQDNPRWSPMAVKSAMMTTARDHASEASNDLFAQGAGFVEPRRFLDAGLVYDADQDDWWAFLAGQGVTFADGSPVSDTPIDASNLNQASIAIGSLAGEQTVTRTVTHVGRGRATYRANVTGLDGVRAVVTPSVLNMRSGQTATFTVKFTRTDAAFNEYTQGHLTWSARGANDVRSPIAVRPVAASVPDEIEVPQGADSFDIPVTPGFTGTLNTEVNGLVAGDVTETTAENTGGAAFDPNDPRNHQQSFTVPAGTTLTRIDLRSSNPDGDDLDLFIENSAGQIIAAAASGAANEVITSYNFPVGTYTIHVQAWSVEGNAPVASFDVRTFTVGDGPVGNLTVEPDSLQVTTGQPVTLTGNLNGIQPGTPYLGWLGFNDGSDLVGRTIVSID